MGADSERHAVTPRQRLIGLLVRTAASIAAALVLGDSWSGRIAIGVGALAMTFLISLSYARALEASTTGVRNTWLAAFYIAEASFFTLFWSVAMAVLDGELTQGSALDGLPIGLIVGALNTWSLWKDCTGASHRIQLPSFGLAGRRRGRVSERDSDLPPQPPQL